MNFIAKNNKRYTVMEDFEKRRDIFRRNYNFVQQFNSYSMANNIEDTSLLRLQINDFSDLTHEEYLSNIGVGYQKDMKRDKLKSLPQASDIEEKPRGQVELEIRPAVQPVQNQFKT